VEIDTGKSTAAQAYTGRGLILKCAVAGLLAGAANGFFGAGGGMFVVPLFSRWAKLPDKQTYASSVAVILPLCAVSAVVYALRGGFDWQTSLPYILGGAVGGLVGGRLFKRVPAKFLRRAFALLLIVAGARSVFF
jgi:uncharacterized membrane protein YfcA